MKRKKWSEAEEQTLLTKYADLLNSGALSKLRTREKKFKPIADHVNSVHHLRDPIGFPFKWSWRDVSIKVQNMRHQYLGVKQKIRVSDGEFNWSDGENHWENFLKYKEVFGDFEIGPKDKKFFDEFGGDEETGEDVLGLGFDVYGEEFDEDDGDATASDTIALVAGNEENEDSGFRRMKKVRKGLVGAQVVELRDAVVRREEKRREREWRREEGIQESEFRMEKTVTESDIQELELEARRALWARREADSRLRLEREFDEERRRRRRMEEKWEEEEMKWRERMVSMQIEHEKQMMQLHADACQNQMQILGVMARLVCQFFGSANDGLGALPPQVLQNMQHPGVLDDSGKPDANSPSEYI